MASARPLRFWLGMRIALAGVLPLALVGALVFGVVLPQLRADIEIRYEALARAIVGQIETHLVGAERELAVLANDLRSRGKQAPSSWFAPLDARLATTEVFAAIYICDRRNRVHAVGLPPASRALRQDVLELDLSRRAFLSETRERGANVWSTTFLSTVTGRLAVALALPVADDVLVGEIALDRLSEFLSRTPASSGMVTMILDREGQIIAHAQPALSGQQISLSHLPVVRDALRGQPRTRDFAMNGETFIGTPVSVPQLGWTVLVAQPRAEALRPFLSTLWALAIAAPLALTLALAVAVALARGLAKRISGYAEHAHAIADGKYDRSWPPSRIAEFDSLGVDLARMSAAIQQRERDLATSEWRYRSVIGNAPVIIFEFDQDGYFTLSDGRGLARVGQAPGQIVGRSIFRLYDHYPAIAENAHRALAGETVQFTTWVEDIFFEISLTPVHEANADTRVIGVAVDLTEWQQAEQALSESEARLRAAIESVPFDFFLIGSDGCYVLQNTTCARKWGNLVGKRPYEVAADACASALWNDNNRRALAGEIVKEEVALTVGNEHCHFYNIVAPVREGDAIRGIVGLNIDITELKRIEEALQRSEAKYRRLHESMRDAIVTVDMVGLIQDFNPAYQQMLGYAEDELRTLSYLDLTPKKWHAFESDILKNQVLTRGFSDVYEKEYRGKDGTVFPVELRTLLLRDAAGEPVAMWAIVRDISERKRAEAALRLTQFSMDRASDSIIWIDERGRMTYVNDAACTSTLYTREELLQMRIFDVDPELSAEEFDEHKTHLQRHGSMKFESTHRRKTGECFPVEVTTNYLEYDGHFHGFAFCRDISERKLAEQRLRESEHEYRELVENANSIILRWNPDGEITFINEYGLNFFGYAEQDLLGRHVVGSIVPPQESAGRNLGPMMQEICHHPERYERNVNENMRRDGQRVWVAWTNRAVRNERGEVTEVLSVGADITERKHAVEALQANEALLAKTTADAPAMIYQFLRRPDGSTCFPYTSAWCQEMFGVRPEALRETAAPLLERILPEDLPGFEQSVARSAQTLDLWRHEFRLLSSRGDVVWHQSISRPEKQADGGILWSGILVDTTDRKRAEEELERHREHLEDLVTERTAELRQAMQQLMESEKLAALGNLVAGVAHELNTPLGNARVVAGTLGEEVRAFAAAVDAGALRRSQVESFVGRSREAVELLERNAQRAADLIGQFKQLAVDQASVRRRCFALCETVRELLTALQPQFKRTSHHVELDIPADLELDSYPGPLGQVLGNLVDNSLTHGFDGIAAGVIQIRACREGDARIRIEYSDNGVGIPEAVCKRVFEPFFTTRLGRGGSGLGLFVAYNLVTSLLGGTIEAGSAEPQGARFVIMLPRRAPQSPHRGSTA